MLIKTRKCTVASLTTGATLNLAQIIGIAVTNHCAYLMSYDLPATIAEKMQAEIPTWQIPAGNLVTFIKSVQMKDGLLIVETEGPLTVMVKDTIDAIVARLTADKMVAGFFPSSNGGRKGQYYYGNVTDNLRNAAQGVENIRLMDETAGLVFTQRGGNMLYTLKTTQVGQPWMSAATVTHRFEQAIKFLGRVQRNKIDVVLMNNTALRATIIENQTTIKKSSLLQQGATAVFGMVKTAGSEFLAALQGQSLVLIPAPTR